MPGLSRPGPNFGTLPSNNQLNHQQAAGNGFRSMVDPSDSDMTSSMTTHMEPQSAFGYGMDAQAAMAVGMMFDGVSSLTPVGYGPQLSSSSSSSSMFDMGGMDVNAGSGSGVPATVPLESSYRPPPGIDTNMALGDLMADGSLGVNPRTQQHHQQSTGAGGSGGNTGYDFIDNDTMAMWSSAPTGFT